MPMIKRPDYRWADRPNGMDKRDYSMKGWTKRRGAWEFLRRSKRYQRACNEIVKSGRDDISDVSPSEYGYRIPLRRLVDYPCDWDEANEDLEFISRSSVLATNANRNTGADPQSCLIFQVGLEAMLSNR